MKFVLKFQLGDRKIINISNGCVSEKVALEKLGQSLGHGEEFSTDLPGLAIIAAACIERQGIQLDEAHAKILDMTRGAEAQKLEREYYQHELEQCRADLQKQSSFKHGQSSTRQQKV